MYMMFSILINGKSFFFKSRLSILEACKLIGIKIPRFCYHETLSIAGNCRMCLVEIATSLKPVVACATEILPGMIISTNSPFVKKSRENILEMLLLNHPLDCPICDQAGECDLQDQAESYGSHYGRNFFNRRSVEKKNCGPFIKTIMTRCIHCTRCVRFGEEICGIKFFGTLNRGKTSEIGNYLIKLSLSEISANVIDLCPVGALTLKSIPFQIRPWEVLSIESLDLTDCLGSNIYLTSKGNDIFRVASKKNNLINASWISNKGRFYFNLSAFFGNEILFQKNDFFSISKIKTPLLFLFNPDLDLKFFYYLKNIFQKGISINSKIFSTSLVSTNLYFWGTKNRLFELSSIKNAICFLISTDLKIELPLLNVRLRSKIIINDILPFGLNTFFKSNFPLQFLRFSIEETLFLFLGKNFFSLTFFKKKILIFSNKSFLNRIDNNFFLLLKEKLNIIFYNTSFFCNSEGINLINFGTLNLKELFFSKYVFGLSLDDNFLLRKLLSKITQFFWVNKLSADILKFLPKTAWLALEINQLSGYFLNFEQKIQKFNLITNNFQFTLLNFIFFIKKTFFFEKKFKKTSNNFILFKNLNNFLFKKIKYFIPLLIFQFLWESLLDPLKFNAYKFFSIFFFPLSFFFSYKKIPFKLILEDSNRTSLQLKYSLPLVKNSQYLSLHDYCYYI
jgi:hypothetical protein